jgi:hypothetical protein
MAKQADPQKLAEAIGSTPVKGQAAEKWADKVWDKATKGGKS